MSLQFFGGLFRNNIFSNIHSALFGNLIRPLNFIFTFDTLLSLMYMVRSLAKLLPKQLN